MGNVGSGVTAVTFDEGKVRYIFVNDRYYEILGYTRQQYQDEIREWLPAPSIPEVAGCEGKVQAAVRTGAPSPWSTAWPGATAGNMGAPGLFNDALYGRRRAPAAGRMSDITAEKR